MNRPAVIFLMVSPPGGRRLCHPIRRRRSVEIIGTVARRGSLTSLPFCAASSEGSVRVSSQPYLLADQPSELERLQLQSRVWEPSGRRLLDEIGAGRGARVLDVGCGAIGWLRLLSEWVGPDGEVVGIDIDERLLAAAGQFVETEGLGNVTVT